MVDIHCHILPALDDGAEDLETSLEMCRMAADDGIDSDRLYDARQRTLPVRSGPG